jgi:hypothetical protein
MKPGDLVRAKATYIWSDSSQVGIIIVGFRTGTKANQGKAWRVLMPCGNLKPKLQQHLEIVNER